MLEAKGIVQTIQGRTVLHGFDCSFREDKIYGIIGPNGAGKSTLLHLLSGVEKAVKGEVLLAEEPILSVPRKALARKLAVLQQNGLPPVGFTVREVVSMGRYPYQSWLGSEEKDPATIIDQALKAMGLTDLQERRMGELSGGERQRVALAKLMVQEPSIILLDEPTTYLDIGYQVQLLDTVRSWQRERGLTVIAVLHDLNLASLYCDELIVLHEGRIAAAGAPKDVLTTALIERVYETTTAIMPHPITGRPQIMLQPSGSASQSRGRSRFGDKGEQGHG